MRLETQNKLLKLQFKFAPIYFIAPSFILFFIFVLWPIFQSFHLSFFEWSGYGEKVFVGFENYKELLKDPDFYVSFWNNIKYLLIMLLAPIFGLLIALFLNQNIKGMRIIKSLFYFPFVINLVVVGLIYSWFYNPDLGILAMIFKKIGLDPIPVLADENLAIYGIIIANLWPQIAYTLILFITGLTSMNAQIVEAGKIDGAYGFKMLRLVILPQLRGAGFIAIVITVVGALRSFDLVATMTAGGPWKKSYVLGWFMYKESFTNFHMGYGASIAVILFLILVIFIVIFLRNIVKNER